MHPLGQNTLLIYPHFGIDFIQNDPHHELHPSFSHRHENRGSSSSAAAASAAAALMPALSRETELYNSNATSNNSPSPGTRSVRRNRIVNLLPIVVVVVEVLYQRYVSFLEWEAS